MRKFAWISLAVPLLLLAGCTRPETPQPPTSTSSTTATTSSGEAHMGGRLVRRLEGDVHTLNYLLQGTDDERQVLQYIYDPLIDFDDKLEPIPGVVTKWEIVDGNRSYILHLDPRATFSDGKPLTAADVIFTLGKIVDSQSPQFAAWFEGLDRAQTKAIDDHTVRVVFAQPRVTQLSSFNIGVLPKHIYENGDITKSRAVVGAGPYVLSRRETGRSILLKRNPHYWREKPPIDSVLFRVIGDDNVAWNALKRGDIDVMRVTNDVWWRDKDDPKVRERTRFFNGYTLAYNCVPWNLQDPLFQDVRVRRAMAMAFDRNTVIERLYHGHARPISGPFPPDSWAADPEVRPIDFNLAGASALLASAGWRDTDHDGVLDREGKRFAFTILIPTGNNTSVEQSQILQDALRKLGVEMSITTLDSSAFFDRVLQGNYQAALVSWFADPDPDPYSLFHSSQVAPNGYNVVHYVNAEADQLMERGRASFDRAERTEIYHQLHELLATDQPYLWLVQTDEQFAVSRRIHNVHSAKGLNLFLWRPGPLAWWLEAKH